MIPAPLRGDGRIDLDALQEAFSSARASSGSSGNVAYLLCNPHNPTGSVHTADELRGIAERAQRFGVRVVSDEIHAPLIPSGARFTPYLSVPGAENAFALMSASKAWNLGGLKAALAIAGREAAADLARMPEEVG
ncbi:aminotransferase class I/II-fold pyridoxal phosphate-dependent enzyme, partial [Neisseria meningitidis]|nr:aminotransferase class I/II-fold pyridoxal phosphate-dependent enzyme [Neisseria meningitidis]